MSNRQHGQQETRTPPPDGALSHRASRWIAITAAVTVIILALCAAILSYVGLRQLATNAGYTGWLPYLFPIVIDGLTLVGSLGVVYSTLSGLKVWYPWALLGIGVCASVAGNVAASPSDDLVSRLVHAAPPIALALALEEMLRVFRHRADRLAREQAAVAQAEKDAADAELAAEQARREHEHAQQEAENSRLVAERERLDAATQAANAEAEAAAAQAKQPDHAPVPAVTTQDTPETPVPDRKPGPDTKSGPSSAKPARTSGTKAGSKKEIILELLEQDPDAEASVIAKRAGTSAQYVRNVRASTKDTDDTQDDTQDEASNTVSNTVPSADPRPAGLNGTTSHPDRDRVPAGAPVPDPVATHVNGHTDPFQPLGQPTPGTRRIPEHTH